MEEITKSEIAVAMLILLLVFSLIIVEYYVVGIIMFAILYNVFMYVRRPRFISSDKNNVVSE